MAARLVDQSGLYLDLLRVIQLFDFLQAFLVCVPLQAPLDLTATVIAAGDLPNTIGNLSTAEQDTVAFYYLELLRIYNTTSEAKHSLYNGQVVGAQRSSSGVLESILPFPGYPPVCTTDTGIERQTDR